MTDKKQDAGPRSEPDDSATEQETILLALDQISQTIDVMTSVVGRLRCFVEEQESSREAELREAMRPGRTLH
jgi:hypothetical protein